tara:strand:+ start:528 stop:830 length:303 start_codon:yes stop_codon:yes gene_type:complete
MNPSTLERLLSSSKAKPFSRASDLGQRVPKYFVDTVHPNHEGDPYINIGTTRTPRYQHFIPSNLPIGDLEKERRRSEKQMMINSKILQMSQKARTISSNY